MKLIVPPVQVHAIGAKTRGREGSPVFYTISELNHDDCCASCAMRWGSDGSSNAPRATPPGQVQSRRCPSRH
eukprot:366622-Prymnesium_polylepis.1